MIPWLVLHALARRGLVLIAALLIAAAGVWAFRQLPIDAYPDISAVSVSIITPVSLCSYPNTWPSVCSRIVSRSMRCCPPWLPDLMNSLSSHGVLSTDQTRPLTIPAG